MYSFNCHRILLVLLVIFYGWADHLLGQFPFQNIVEQSGINGHKYYYGISVSDMNGDHFEDLIITFTDAPPRVFLNNGNETYTDITEQSGFDYEGSSRMCAWVDMDNDGQLDIFVAGKNSADQLFMNNGDGSFHNVSESYGINKVTNTFSLNIAEINEDPYPDLYLSNFLQENTLYLNEGRATIKDRVHYYQLWDSGKSMASIFFDFDDDGDDDLYLVHDGNQSNILYQNIGGSYYEDVSIQSATNIAANGMGVDVADINLDGCLDLYITNLYENNLLLNNCDGTFSDISESSSVDDYGMGWGTTFIDYDNDGYVDILACNDSYFSDYPNVLYRNIGDLTFTKIEMDGSNKKTGSYGCVCTDINLDGKMDLAIANQNPRDEFQLLKNVHSSENNWVGFSLKGSKCNSQAIGTRIKVLDTNRNIHVDQVTGGNGYASQGSPMMHFGLGNNEIVSVQVKWPDGEIQEIIGLDANKYYAIIQGSDAEVIYSTTSINYHPQQKSSIHLFPNPAQNYTQVSINNISDEALSISLTDMVGNTLFSSSNLIEDSKAYHFLLNELGELTPGVYLVTINSNNHIFTQRLVINN